MPKTVFIQRNIDNRIIYVVEKNALEITTYRFGQSSKLIVPLKSISPDCSIHSRSVTGLLVVALGLVLIVVTTAGFVARLKILSGFDFVVKYVFGLVTLAGVIAFRAFQPLEYFVFRDVRGRQLFSIRRTHQNDEDSNDFVAGLVDRLEQVHSGITFEPPPEAVSKSAVVLPSAEARGPLAYWFLAFISAIVGIAFPPLEAMADETAAFGFLFVCGGVTCAIAASVASFAHKESKRFWSVLAVALSFLPFAIY